MKNIGWGLIALLAFAVSPATAVDPQASLKGGLGTICQVGNVKTFYLAIYPKTKLAVFTFNPSDKTSMSLGMFEHRTGEGVTAFFPTEMTIIFVADPGSGLQSKASVTSPDDLAEGNVTCDSFRNLE